MSAAFAAPDGEERYRQTRRKVFSGAKALGLRHVLVGLLSLGGSTLLIRDVGPAAWASYGIAYLLIAFADQSLSTRVLGHLVRKRDEPDEQEVATAAALMVVVGLAILISFLILSAPIAHLYGRDDLAPCLTAVGVCVMVYSLRSTSTALLERSMDYRAIGIAEVMDQLTFYAVAVTTVATGAGITGIAWALGTRGILAALWLRRRRPAPLLGHPQRAQLRPMLRFAGPSVATGLVLLLDGLIAPLLLGGGHAVELGFYMTAATIAGYGIAVAVVSQRISFPGLASLQGDPAQFAHGLQRGLSVTMTTVISSIAPLVATSPLWLPALLGSEWEHAAPGMVLYGAGLVFGTFVYAIGYSLASLGHPRDALWTSVAMTASFAAFVALLLPFTTLLACPIGYLASRLVGLPVALVAIWHRGHPVRWRSEAARLAFGVSTFVAVGLLLHTGRGLEAGLLALVGSFAWVRLVRDDLVALVRGLRSADSRA